MCIFCSIIEKRIPARIIYEDEAVLAFHDVHPLAPVHVLIIPKAHIASIDDVEAGQAELIGRMVVAARNIARDLNISEKGYKLLFRVGTDGGQEVPHIHLHLIGGAKLAEGIHPVNS